MYLQWNLAKCQYLLIEQQSVRFTHKWEATVKLQIIWMIFLWLTKNWAAEFGKHFLRELWVLVIYVAYTWYVSEFIAGGTLKSRLMDASVELPWELRVKLAKDVSSGMVLCDVIYDMLLWYDMYCDL